MIEHMEEKLWVEFLRRSSLPDVPKRRYCDYHFDRLRWKGFRGVRDINRRDRLFWTPHMQTDFFPALWRHWARMAACKERKRYYLFMAHRFHWKQHSTQRRGRWHI